MSDRDLICYIIGAVTEGILIIVERPREEYLNHIPEKYLGDLVDKLEIAEDYETLAMLRDAGLLPGVN